jgi:hypothetical protein
MVKHIVLWKLHESYSEKEKQAILREFMTRLLKLDKTITVLLHLEVYLRDQETADSNYDIMLDTVFHSLADLQEYQEHPDHQKVVSYIKGLKLHRAAIDFTF